MSSATPERRLTCEESTMGIATRLERPQRVYARRPKKIWERYAVRDVMRNEVMRHICGEPPDSTLLPSSPHWLDVDATYRIEVV